MLKNKTNPVWFRVVILWSGLNMLVSASLGSIWLLDWTNRPFDLLATVLHELGHALACILTGGQVIEIGLGNYGEGVTRCLGGARFIYGQAGYLAVPLVSALVLRVLRRGADARLLLVTMGVLVGLTELCFFKDRVSNSWGSLLAAALVFTGLRCGPDTGRLVVKLVVVELLVNCAEDFVVLARYATGLFGSHVTDAAVLAEMTGLPAGFYCALWILLSLAILAVVPGALTPARHKARAPGLPAEPLLVAWRDRRPAAAAVPAADTGDEDKGCLAA